jgi:hypothetical protein
MELARIAPTPIRHRMMYMAFADAIPNATPIAFFVVFLIPLFTTRIKSGPGLSNAIK